MPHDLTLQRFYDLGPDFEQVVLGAILSDGGFYAKFRPILLSEAFVVENHRFLIDRIGEHFEKYGTVPQRDTLLDTIRQSRYRDKGGVVSLIQGLQPIGDVGYVRDRMLSWAKWRAVDAAVQAGDDGDPKVLAAEVDRAARTGDDLAMEHTRLERDEEGEQVRARSLPTPWVWLNERLNGGPVEGDLCVVLTVINGGKTTALVDIAVEALRRGLSVVYLTFEDGELNIKRRMMQAIGNMTIEEMLARPRYARRLRTRFIKTHGGICQIKDVASRRTTVEDAVGFVRSVEDATERKVDLLITDYADRFRAKQRYSEPRHALREVFEDCKWAARSLKLVHWTARQVNKTKVGQELVGAEHAAEAYGTMESPDLVVGLGQTLEDERLGRITLYTSKVRDARRHEVKVLLVEFDRQRIFESEGGQ